MLKIEDLKVGDELEFISDEDKRRFTNSYYDNVSMVSNCFPKGTGEITHLGVRWIEFKGDCSRLKVINREELRYFRKVETNKEVIDTPEVDSTYANAGIKSTKEMYTRLLEGEVFYFEDERYVFENGYFYTRYKEGGVDPYINLREKFKHFQVKKPWHEFASEDNPILCKVWSIDEEIFLYDKVIGKDSISFITESYGHMRYAVPVKPSECFQG